MSLVEFSLCCDFFGLPMGTWVVREFLSLEFAFTAFRGMPVAKERRYFIERGEVFCRHPYWPLDSIQDARGPDGGELTAGEVGSLVCAMNAEESKEIDLLTALSKKVSRTFEGAWSLDWAKTVDGLWMAIDMAPAARSFHWAGCPNEKRKFGEISMAVAILQSHLSDFIQHPGWWAVFPGTEGIESIRLGEEVEFVCDARVVRRAKVLGIKHPRIIGRQPNPFGSDRSDPGRG